MECSGTAFPTGSDYSAFFFFFFLVLLDLTATYSFEPRTICDMHLFCNLRLFSIKNMNSLVMEIFCATRILWCDTLTDWTNEPRRAMNATKSIAGSKNFTNCSPVGSIWRCQRSVHSSNNETVSKGAVMECRKRKRNPSYRTWYFTVRIIASVWYNIVLFWGLT